MFQTSIDYTGDLFAPAASATHAPVIKTAPAPMASHASSTVRSEDRLARAARMAALRVAKKHLAQSVPTEKVKADIPAPAPAVAPMPSAPEVTATSPMASVPKAAFAFEPIPSGEIPVAAPPFSLYADYLAAQENDDE